MRPYVRATLLPLLGVAILLFVTVLVIAQASADESPSPSPTSTATPSESPSESISLGPAPSTPALPSDEPSVEIGVPEQAKIEHRFFCDRHVRLTYEKVGDGAWVLVERDVDMFAVSRCTSSPLPVIEEGL